MDIPHLSTESSENSGIDSSFSRVRGCCTRARTQTVAVEALAELDDYLSDSDDDDNHSSESDTDIEGSMSMNNKVWTGDDTTTTFHGYSVCETF